MPLRGARVQQSRQNLCEMVCGTLPPPYPSPACGGGVGGVEAEEKEPPFLAAPSHTGRRQTEWIGATRCPQNGHAMNGAKHLNGV